MQEIIKTVIGLEGLYYAPIPASGLIDDAVFERLGYNLEGSFTMNQEEDTSSDIMIEESDSPLDTILKKGKFMLETDIPDLRAELARKVMNATVTSGVNTEGKTVLRVKLPDSAQYIYGMFKIVPKKGVEQFYITRGQISAYITGNLSKTEPLNMHLKVTALIPLSGETNAVEYDIVSGTNPGYLLGTTFDPDWDVVDAFDNVTNGAVTITVDGGSAQSITGLNFSTATTVAAIVAILNAATNGAVWSFDENEYRFKLTSSSLGSASSVAVTNGGSGTNLNVTTLLGTNGQTPVAGS